MKCADCKHWNTAWTKEYNLTNPPGQWGRCQKLEKGPTPSVRLRTWDSNPVVVTTLADFGCVYFEAKG